jgi:tryptophanyl-tRNA synthetase
MRLFSGVRPTGSFHLGNYLGAVQQWGRLSSQAEMGLFCVVDWHALTTIEDQRNLGSSTRMIAATYLACGLDPQKILIFPQSQVYGHLELAWYLGCQTPLGWLQRMTQFKDKSRKNQDQADWGLLSYPVLMAADILLYQSTHVPVGEDQKQHVELARDLSIRWNQRFHEETFKVPEPLIVGQSARIMSLRDGLQKMSKSDSSDYSRIHLTDSNDLIALKIQKAKTDPFHLPSQVDELNNRPEASNLLNLVSILSKHSFEQVINDYSGQSFSLLKKNLIHLLVDLISPIREEIQKRINDRETLDRMLKDHGEKARELARPTLERVRQILNLWPNLN